MNKKEPISIYIVEDNKIFTLALKADIETAFSNTPIKIQSFETGEDCMTKFKVEKPQIVILDYNLNSKYPTAADGIKVLDWIKHENPDTHVIILTGNDSLDIALKSLKHGASDYVVKTETQFRKINYSLLNIFNTLKAKREAKKYKSAMLALTICIVGWISVLFVMQMVNPPIGR